MGLITRVQTYWNDYGFEIVFITCVLIILIGAIFRRGKKGTWSSLYFNPIEERDNLMKSRPNFERGVNNNYNDDNNTYNNKKKDSIGETICREYLERKFGKSFKKARPNFLRNPVTGGDFNLELDCYNPELNLALEYNGAQHYKYIPFFHRNKEAFLNQKYRDEMKRTKCIENGIRLIEVPYTVKPHDMEQFVAGELAKFGFR